MSCQASIVIPTYNRRELLRLTLESLARQDARTASFEVIVVDDGSTDGSLQAVQEFASRLDVSCVRQEHLGFRVGRARNLGVERARGDTVVFVDSGMVLASRFVSSHLAAHGDGAPVAVLGYVHGYDFNISSPELIKTLHLVEADPDSSIAAMAATHVGLDIREHVYRVIHDRMDGLPAPWTLFWTTNVSLSRKAFHDAGGFDEDFAQWGMEDIELGFRLWRKGVRFLLSRQAAGIHYPHERDNAANLRSHAENRRLFLYKHPTIESEAFLASDPLRFNFELLHYRSHEQARSALWRERMSAGALGTGKGELGRVGAVVFGFRDGRLLALCDSRAGIDADAARVASASQQYPGVDVGAQLGIRTSFADRQFDSCLLAGAALGLPKPWLMAMAAEAARIARRSHALVFDKVPFELHGTNTIARLGDGLNLCELGR